MSTVNNRKRRGNVENPDENEIPAESVAENSPPPIKRRRRVHFWGATLALLALVLWLAPLVVSHTPLLNHVVGSMTARLNGEATVQSASLGWFSPLVLNDVQIRDADGKPALRAARMEIGQPLWRLFFGRTNLGRVTLLQPEMQLTLSSGGSNLEKLLAAWLDTERSGTLACPSAQLEIVEGTLAIDDLQNDRHWQIEQLNLAATLFRDWTQPLEVTLSGSLPQPDRRAECEVKAQIGCSQDAEGLTTSSGKATIKSQGLPLSIVESFLQRSRPDLQLAGWLSSDATITWKPAAVDDGARQAESTGPAYIVSFDGELAAAELLLAGPFTGRDQLRMKRVVLPCKATLAGRQLGIERLKFDCDVGQAELKGPVQVDLSKGVREGGWSVLAGQTYELEGELDLARLAMALPETIRIRAGTEITAGQMSVRLSRRNDGRGSLWQGRVETSNLVATSDGRPITWKKPVLMTFSAHDGPHGPVVDKLVCQSKFLEIEAAGELDSMSASAIYDLNELSAELGQFIDLGDLKMSGDGWSYVTWKRGEGGQFEADGEFQVRKFHLGAPGRRPWNEENLIVLASLVGQADKRRLERIDALSLKVDSQDDRLTARLLKPVTNLSTAGDWPVEAQLQGQLTTWMPRLELLLGDLPWDLAGTCRIEASGVGSAQQITIERSKCTIAGLHAHGSGLRIDEPQVDMELAGAWKSDERAARIDSLKLASSALAADGRDLSLEWPVGRPPRLVGTTNFSGDLARLQQWSIDPNQPPLWRIAGAVQGKLQMTVAGSGVDETTAARLDVQADDLVATRPQSEPWREEQARLTIAARHDRLADALLVDRVEVTSAALKCDAGGRIADLSGRRDATLSGQLDYDPQLLLALLRPYLGEGIEIVAGRESRPFKFQGPLAALSGGVSVATQEDAVAAVDRMFREFSGEAAFGWTGANVHGFRLASGELRGQLADGVLNIVPLNLVASEGRLTAAPRVRLWPEPKELTLERGPLLTQVRISPEMCEAGLKYVAPVLAGVTQAQGQFSLAMNGCRLPLDRPDQGELAGTFTVHSVEIGPGPLIRELSVLMDRPSPARLTRESVVPFKMVDGRVYHRDLELVFAEFTVRTHGSVGLDHSLDILAEMPVPPKWIGNNALGTALKNQTIKLPIGGTLEQPKIDQKALAQVSADFLRGGATNLLRDTLNKQFDRLFAPPKQQE